MNDKIGTSWGRGKESRRPKDNSGRNTFALVALIFFGILAWLALAGR